jgi:hypothetical protein
MDRIRHGSNSKGKLMCRGMHGPIQQGDARASSSEPNYARWLSGPGSAGHFEPILRGFLTVRDFRLYSGFRYDLCRSAGLTRGAPASFKRRHGSPSDSLGLLRLVDRFSTWDCIERDRRVDQFFEPRRVPPFRPHRKSQARKLTADSAGGRCRPPMDQETST